MPQNKIRIKNTLADIACSVLAVKKILEEHKEVYLKINGEQSVKLRDETRGFS